LSKILASNLALKKAYPHSLDTPLLGAARVEPSGELDCSVVLPGLCQHRQALRLSGGRKLSSEVEK